MPHRAALAIASFKSREEKSITVYCFTPVHLGSLLHSDCRSVCFQILSPQGNYPALRLNLQSIFQKSLYLNRGNSAVINVQQASVAINYLLP